MSQEIIIKTVRIDRKNRKVTEDHSRRGELTPATGYAAIITDLEARRVELAKTAINHDGPWHEWDAVQKAVYHLKQAEDWRLHSAELSGTPLSET
jgi:hypothetical protein